MSSQQKEGFFYGFIALFGILTPWLWATGMICLVLDYVVKYLSMGREEEIKKLINEENMSLKLEIETLKVEVLKLKEKY